MTPKSGLAGVTRDDLVLNIDLAPTFLDLAGVAVPKDMHGKSWKPLLAKDPPREPFRTSFFYEYFQEDSPKKKATALAVGGYNTPTMTAVRTATHKLLRYQDRPSGRSCSTSPPTHSRRRTCSPTPNTPRCRRGWRRSTTGSRRSSNFGPGRRARGAEAARVRGHFPRASVRTLTSLK